MDPRKLDWSEYVGSMPREGVRYAKPMDKAELTERFRKALRARINERFSETFKYLADN